MTDTDYESFDRERFTYRSFQNSGQRSHPDLVLIGLHGFSGAARDFEPVAKHLLPRFSNLVIYAPNTRGQGYDPVPSRRGHIRHESEWFRDLQTFTGLIRRRHPEARVIWCGESMGSLIALHTLASGKEACPEGLILSSPISTIKDDLPRWKERLAQTLALIFPRLRVSLEDLSGKHDAKVTDANTHRDQASKNPYHVPRQTLHLLSTLAKLIRRAPTAAAEVEIPVLLLHGGKDVFTNPADIIAFEKDFTGSPSVTRLYFPDSHHLLFYDSGKEKVLDGIAAWLKKFPRSPSR